MISLNFHLLVYIRSYSVWCFRQTQAGAEDFGQGGPALETEQLS